MNDERGEDSEAPAELREIDDDLEQALPRGGGLGAVGQLLATLAFAAIVALVLVGALAVLSWLFT